ncbi:DUF7521 family protein [Halolamina salina]|uniref:Uncharacterized protein n=1 Tax=Halolamina salina TaxID=1220023 RepID=A0ABD6B9C0_9EURY
MTAEHTTDDRAAPRTRRRSRSVAAFGAAFGPLQSVSVEQGATSTIEIAFLLALAAIGALLTYQAIRGYRRNDDPSMVLFGCGLFLLTVGHAGLKLFLTFVVPALGAEGPVLAFAVASASQIADIAGLGAVFYAILR